MIAGKKYCLLLLLVSAMCFAQDRASFTRDKEFYIQGNATVLGNSILGKSATKSFDKADKVNDEFKMRYIDIDNDPNTWSSSSASFSIPENSTIIYAGLYWTATYYGEQSGARVSDDVVYYKKLQERAHNPQFVKLKPPNGVYLDITGTLIYDGAEATNRTVKSRAPYAYMADVTQEFQNYYQGDVTVANVAATQGKINGGSSAGWLLYLVYENEEEPFQYITTYYGLESVKKEVVEIDFGSFKSSEDGELETQITVGALEGDINLDKDQVRIYNPKSKIYLPFGNRVRPPNNFFNSSITSLDELVLDRTPNSKNTLGFDIAQVSLDKELNTILANSAQGVKMQFNTRGDHYFLFFTAFQTTISESFYKENQTGEIALGQDSLEVTRVIQEAKIPDNRPVILSTTVPSVISENTLELVEEEPMSSAQIPQIQSGYYLISNVFSRIENAQKWKQILSSKGYESTIFLRPDNNFHYVSLANSADLSFVENLKATVIKDKELEKSWILKINM